MTNSMRSNMAEATPTTTLDAAAPAELPAGADDAAFLAQPFVQQLIKQLRAQDTHGAWDGKTDLQLLRPTSSPPKSGGPSPFWATPTPRSCGGSTSSTTRSPWPSNARRARWCRP